jgi:hypothetical protein
MVKNKSQGTRDYLNNKKSYIFIVIFGLIGLLFVLFVSAAPYSSSETENGTISGSALIANDPNASGGKLVAFGQSQTVKPIDRIMSEAPYYGAGLYWPIARTQDGVDDNDEYRIHVERVGKGKKPDVLRVFGSSTTGSWKWPNVADANVTGHDGVTWVSFKIDTTAAASGSQNTAWTNSVKTISTTGKPVMITVHHEPENDAPDTGTDAWILNWIKAQVQIGKAVKAANNPNVVYGPIFMGKYYLTDISATSPKNLNNYMKVASDNGLLDDLQSLYDFVGWDPYHEGTRTDKKVNLNPPRDTADYWFSAGEDFNDKYFPGKKFAIGETGYVNELPELGRLNWLKSIKSWVDARPNKVLAVCYFDASITVNWYLSLGPGGRIDTPYQKQVAEYWGSLYK